MNKDREDGIFCSRKAIHENFEGEVSNDNGYADEYVEWLEDSIISHFDGLIYNIDDFKNRARFYNEKLKDETISDERRRELELKYRNMSSRVIGMEMVGMGLYNKLINKI